MINSIAPVLLIYMSLNQVIQIFVILKKVVINYLLNCSHHLLYYQPFCRKFRPALGLLLVTKAWKLILTNSIFRKISRNNCITCDAAISCKRRWKLIEYIFETKFFFNNFCLINYFIALILKRVFRSVTFLIHMQMVLVPFPFSLLLIIPQ